MQKNASPAGFSAGLSPMNEIASASWIGIGAANEHRIPISTVPGGSGPELLTAKNTENAEGRKL